MSIKPMQRTGGSASLDSVLVNQQNRTLTGAVVDRARRRLVETLCS
jgi:hypothetical protein